MYSSTGPNGIAVNRRTRIRDQERSPVAADLKRVMREKARLGQRTFALTADVAEAHRQIPIHPRDWHLLGCQIEAGGDVYINKVGTFGVASASYYWSRAATALGRLTQYITGRTANTWHQLVAGRLSPGGQWDRVSDRSDLFLCSLRDSWSTSLLGEDGRRRQSHVGRVRAPPPHVPPGDLGKTRGLVREVGRGSRQLRQHQYSQLRRGARAVDVCSWSARVRETLPVAVVQLPLSAPQRSCEEGPSSRETFPAVPFSPSLTVSALQLCDHDASMGHG